MKKIDGLIVIFIIVTSIYSLRDLFKQGFYTSHDGPHQVVRLYYFDQAVRDRQIPPRWISNLLNGYGYPLFIFSYHLPWFIAEPFRLFGFSVFSSIKITFILGFLLSGITMYLWQKEMFGRLAAFVGMAVYLFAPFRFSNIFVRAAIGDATVFIFPPLLFLSLYKLSEKKRIDTKWIIVGGFSLSGILLSHAMVSLFYIIAFWLFVIFYFIIKRKIFFLASSIFMFILSFAFSSYYFLPSLIERNFTRFADTINVTYALENFVKFRDLLYSTWGYGMMKATEGAMSLQVGIVQWCSVLLSVFFLTRVIYKHKTNKRIHYVGFYFLFIFIFSIILMLPISKFIWISLSKIANVDFPWRILSLVIFAASVLSGYVIASINSKKYRVILGLVLITLSFYTNRNHLRINQVLDWPQEFYLKLERTTNTYDEYTPKWASIDVSKKPEDIIEFSDTKSQINVITEKTNLLAFSIDASEKGKARINKIYYPGLVLTRNDQLEDFQYKNSGGLIEFTVPKGFNSYKLVFKNTFLRTIANVISLLSVIIAISVLVRPLFIKLITNK